MFRSSTTAMGGSMSPATGFAGHDSFFGGLTSYTDAMSPKNVVLGWGLVGRREMAFEVAAAHRCRGLGRLLAHAARCLTPVDETVWAQVAPPNAASLRTLLAAGFVPVCSEVLLVPS